MTIEARLVEPFDNYALEQLRTRFLFSAVSTHLPADGAKVAVQMSFDTEVGKVLVKLTTVSPSVLKTTVATRRRFLEVDNDLRAYKFLLQPALDALSELLVPVPYVNFLSRHMSSSYPRYRVSATATLLCLAAVKA